MRHFFNLILCVAILSTLSGCFDSKELPPGLSSAQKKGEVPSSSIDKIQQHLSLVKDVDATHEFPVTVNLSNGKTIRSDDALDLIGVEVLSFSPHTQGATMVSDRVAAYTGFTATVRIKDKDECGAIRIPRISIDLVLCKGTLHAALSGSDVSVTIQDTTISPIDNTAEGGATAASAISDFADGLAAMTALADTPPGNQPPPEGSAPNTSSATIANLAAGILDPHATPLNMEGDEFPVASFIPSLANINTELILSTSPSSHPTIRVRVTPREGAPNFTFQDVSVIGDYLSMPANVCGGIDRKVCEFYVKQERGFTVGDILNAGLFISVKYRTGSSGVTEREISQVVTLPVDMAFVNPMSGVIAGAGLPGGTPMAGGSPPPSSTPSAPSFTQAGSGATQCTRESWAMTPVRKEYAVEWIDGYSIGVDHLVRKNGVLAEGLVSCGQGTRLCCHEGMCYYDVSNHQVPAPGEVPPSSTPSAPSFTQAGSGATQCTRESWAMTPVRKEYAVEWINGYSISMDHLVRKNGVLAEGLVACGQGTRLCCHEGMCYYDVSNSFHPAP